MNRYCMNWVLLAITVWVIMLFAGCEKYDPTIILTEDYIVYAAVERDEYHKTYYSRLYRCDTEGNYSILLKELDGYVSNLVVLPDGSHFIYYLNNPMGSAIYVVDSDGGNAYNLTGEMAYHPFILSPEGATLYFPSYTKIFAVRISGFGLTQIAESDTIASTLLDISPDGSLLLVKGEFGPHLNKQLFLVELDKTDTLKQITYSENPIEHAFFSSDAKRVIFTLHPLRVRDDSTGFGIYVLDIESYDLKVLDATDEWIVSPYRSPYSNRIFYIKNNDLYSINLDGTEQTLITRGEDTVYHPVEMSDQNHLFVYSYLDNTLSTIDLNTRTITKVLSSKGSLEYTFHIE